MRTCTLLVGLWSTRQRWHHSSPCDSQNIQPLMSRSLCLARKLGTVQLSSAMSPQGRWDESPAALCYAVAFSLQLGAFG